MSQPTKQCDGFKAGVATAQAARRTRTARQNQAKTRSALSLFVSLCLDDIDYFSHVCITELLCLGFNHDADQWLCAGFTHQDATFIRQTFLDRFYCCDHSRIVLGIRFAFDADILQGLRINFDWLGQFAERLFFCQHDFHDFQRSEDTVAGVGVFAEDNMTGLFAADAVIVFHHMLIYVFVMTVVTMVLFLSLPRSFM